MPGRPFLLVRAGVWGHKDGVFPRSLNSPPTASFDWSKLGDGEVDFTDTSHDPESNISTYEWAFGDGESSTSQNPTHTYGSDGSYDVSLTVTDSEGLSDNASETISVEVNDPPTADFSYTDAGGGTFEFTDTSTDDEGNISSYSWDFGDGSTSTAQNPTHTYASGGTYTVSLTVTDSGGLSDSVSKDITYEVTWSGTESFESGSWPLSGWQHTNLASSDAYIDSRAAGGSQSLRINNGGNNTINHSGGYTSAIKQTVPTGQYPDFTVHYREQGSGTGGFGFWLVDDSGNKIVAMGTTNPQPVWRDSGGRYNAGSASTGNWYSWSVTFDWDNSTFDIDWNNGSDSYSNRNFIDSSASNIAEIHIGCFDEDMNGKMQNAWTDLISTA